MSATPISLNLARVQVRAGRADKTARCEQEFAAHHYLPVAQAAGDRCWQAPECDSQWVAVLLWCAAAKRLKAREAWIGWTPRTSAERFEARRAKSALLPAADVTSPAASSAKRFGTCRTRGTSATATRRCSPRPLSIRSASKAPATRLPAGRWRVPPRATALAILMGRQRPADFVRVAQQPDAHQRRALGYYRLPGKEARRRAR